MKKRTVVALLLCLLVLSGAGCGKKTTGTDEPTPSQTVSTVSLTQGVDVVLEKDLEENAVQIDFETGSVISVPDAAVGSEQTDTASEVVGETIDGDDSEVVLSMSGWSAWE